MALPCFGPSIFTSPVGFTAFKRRWSSVPWSLRKSLRSPGFVLRVCHSFPLYTPSQVVCPHIARLCQALPTLCCSVDSFVAQNTGSSFGETACAFKRVSVNLRAVARLWSPADPGLSVICRITTPLHNQGSRRRSRHWKSLSAGLMVGWGKRNSLAAAQCGSDTSPWCWWGLSSAPCITTSLSDSSLPLAAPCPSSSWQEGEGRALLAPQVLLSPS